VWKSGRKHEKNVRNSAKSRYIQRWYFLHNNRAIRECYIDSFIRIKTDYEKLPIGELIKYSDKRCEHHEKTMHALKQLEGQIKKLPLLADKKRRFYSALDVTIKNLEQVGDSIQFDGRMTETIRTNKKLTELIKNGMNILGFHGRAEQNKRPEGEPRYRQIQSGRFDRQIQSALEFDTGGLLQVIGDIFANHEVIRELQKKRRKRMLESYNHPSRILPT
jgi:hypothetical protein